MNFREFFMGLPAEQREAYAERAGTSVAYILVGFASCKGKPRKVPKPDMLRRLVDASEGKVSMAEALEYFGYATLDELRAFFEAEGADQADQAQHETSNSTGTSGQVTTAAI